MRLSIFLIVVLAALWTPTAWADSPLTSADFSLAYTDSDWVVRASEVGMDAQLQEALRNPEVLQDERAAIINALGWSVAGQQHATAFAQTVAAAHEVRLEGLTVELLTNEELFAMGYLLAMDDYQGLAAQTGAPELDALKAPGLLAAAADRTPDDFTVALILGLVRAQQATRSNWCEVYKAVFGVLDGFSGERNMRKDAVATIAEYIQLYQSECTNPRPVKGP